MKKDLTTAAEVLEWAYMTVSDRAWIDSDTGQVDATDPVRETAAYLAECVRLRQAFDAEWPGSDIISSTGTLAMLRDAMKGGSDE